ncbi:DUF6917 domain-containing protein [Streptomyces noursei]|uniref:DUF6917 domain-containing protein n=1 Tax=Streptomyces noursei TaxID=1971 RepID=UPI0023B7C8B2|nr:hypothetical protein [Streptomyces noursei]
MMFTSREPLRLRWAAVMDHTRHDRAIEPSAWQTRCIRAGEVHEFINVGPGPRYPVDHVEYYGFATFETSGVLAVGDALVSEGRTLGTISGFDETHMPNHYNILVEGADFRNGHALGLKAGTAVTTCPREDKDSGGS